MKAIELTAKEQSFVDQYFKTAFWADFFQDDMPIDLLDDDCLREGTIDALCFYSRAAMYLSEDNFRDAAHTFYLVRQGHGAAFSDNPHLYSEFVMERLKALADSFGAVEYFTKDGQLLSDLERVQ